jgi:hypothetical protein
MVSFSIRILNLFSGIFSLGLLSIIVLQFGFKLSLDNQTLFSQIYEIGFYFYVLDILVRLVTLNRVWPYFRQYKLDLVVLFPFLLMLFDLSFSVLLPFVLMVFIVRRYRHVMSLFNFVRLKPTQSLLGGFVFLIFVGSLILSFPVSSVSGHGVSYVDALFTATSSVCVTGLSTVSVIAHFSLFGQWVILILIQLGGLGIMALSALLDTLRLLMRNLFR